MKPNGEKEIMACEINENDVKELAGTHVMVLFGDGHGRPAELAMESKTEKESQAICDFVLRLREQRKVRQ